MKLLSLRYYLLTFSITFFYNMILPFVADARYVCQHVPTVRADAEFQIVMQGISWVPSGLILYRSQMVSQIFCVRDRAQMHCCNYDNLLSLSQ